MTAAVFTSRERKQLARFIGVILILHLAGWGLVWWWARPYPFLVGLAGLAYSFGLRHAFDADHIAAIDNTTRKLMTGGTRPLGVGFFFSLGHSTVVFLLTAAIAAAAHVVTTELPSLRAVGAYVGTTVSGVFLYAIGILNLLVMIDIVRVFRAVRRGGVRGGRARSASSRPRRDQPLVQGPLSPRLDAAPDVLDRSPFRPGL